MSYKSVMVIKAVVCLVFGVLLLLAPGTTFGLLGATLTPSGMFPAREYSAALLGILMLTWFARNAVESDARRAIILALFVYDLIGVLVSLQAVLSGVLNPLGWFIVVIYLFFTIMFGRLLFTPKAAS
jgi:hypothetical protein